MPSRVFGIETEFGLNVVRQGAVVSPEEAARTLFAPLPRSGSVTNLFLENGARLYLDVGSHPEYATAECTTVREVVLQDLAGSAVLSSLSTLAEAQDQGTTVTVLRNNTDYHGHTYGCHENYQIERSVDLDVLVSQLASFLATRQLICGAGGVSDDGTRLVLSQRAAHMDTLISANTLRSRPLINTRDEALADNKRFRRLHVIVGDSNVNPWSTYLKLGATDLVLCALERGYCPPSTLADVASAVRDTADDLSGLAQLRMDDGSQATALEVQQRWLAVCADMPALTQEQQSVLNLWAVVLDALDCGDLQDVARYVDWAAKELVRRSAGSRWSLAQLRQFDLRYHDVRRERSPFTSLRARGFIADFADDARIWDSVERAPRTRATVRAEFLQGARRAGKPVQVDWVTLRTVGAGSRAFVCRDARRSRNPGVATQVDQWGSEN